MLLGLIGGVLIGLASSLLLLTLGRIAGFSGIIGGLLERNREDRAWRWAFLFGVVSAGALLFQGQLIFFPNTYHPPLSRMILAGLLVGFGTRLGSGCTSGHGVCGVARLSKRSLVATLVFMAAGMLTVYFFSKGLTQ